MKYPPVRLLPLVLTAFLAGCAGSDAMPEAGYDQDAGAGPRAMAHVGHVVSGWTHTPGQSGLLTTARQEAAVVRKHADLALQRAQDSNWVKMQAVHIRHALLAEGEGPGKGYGLLKAAKGVKQHILLAAGQDDASESLIFHSKQVAASADSVLMRSNALLQLVEQVLDAPRHTSLRIEAEEMAQLADAILMGADLNQDGHIGWQNQEPGLNQALKYVNYLQQKEQSVE